jgi:hypothetical protein
VPDQVEIPIGKEDCGWKSNGSATRMLTPYAIERWRIRRLKSHRNSISTAAKGSMESAAIFTDSNTPDGEFGFLAQQCFEERESIIDYLKDG